jgi:hypothetical protein
MTHLTDLSNFNTAILETSSDSLTTLALAVRMLLANDATQDDIASFALLSPHADMGVLRIANTASSYYCLILVELCRIFQSVFVDAT